MVVYAVPVLVGLARDWRAGRKGDAAGLDSAARVGRPAGRVHAVAGKSLPRGAMAVA